MATPKDMLSYFRHAGEWQRIEFATLEGFMEELRETGVHEVRLDAFDEARPSELSFVHYVTATLFLTASCPRNTTLYQYTEALGTMAVTEKTSNGTFSEAADARLLQIRQRLRSAGFIVRKGRHILPG